MAVTITQTCDRCGLSRNLDGSEEHHQQRAGWRELTAGGLKATVCSGCIRQLIESWRGRGESEAT